MSSVEITQDTTKDLGDGLLLRWSTADDIDRIAQLVGQVFRQNEADPPNIRMADQVSVTLRGDYPYMAQNEFIVVEDTTKPGHPFAACSCLWQHRWSYGGIKFHVGRPEYVASLPEYRNRGLIRHIFNEMHERSDGRGDLMQGITGIPYFYRQFDYEMVLDLDARRSVLASLLPAKKQDEEEQCSLRPATVEDVPTLTALHDQNRGDSLLWHEVGEPFWRYLTEYWYDPAIQQADRTLVGINGQPHIIFDRAGNILGMITMGHHRWGRELSVYELALAEQTNLHTIMPSLLRAVRAYGEQAPVMHETAPAFSHISFQLGCNHPLYALLGDTVAPRIEEPYAWYIRVPDVPAFIRHVASVFEERLAQSVFTGYTGELLFDFYRTGLRLTFEQGKLAVAEPWRAPYFEEPAVAGCPPLIFLQLLLGYRSLAELLTIFPDVWAKHEVRLLIDTIFPKQGSVLMPLG